jgi:hypothetical protein
VKIGWNYDEAVRGLSWLCRGQQLGKGLETTFFMCVDREDVANAGLLLVRMDWDGKVWGRTREEMLGLTLNGLKSVRVPIKEALFLLEQGRVDETNGI